MVIFGAGGDLTHLLLVPSRYWHIAPFHTAVLDGRFTAPVGRPTIAVEPVLDVDPAFDIA